MKKFDYCIGNPPYNADFSDSGDNGKYAKPVYNEFMDAANTVANSVELVHPARFLFNAGSTPKSWNEKMLQDEHFKVLYYEADASKVFPATEIKGGVAITYHDFKRNFGSIGLFIPMPELRSVVGKVQAIEKDNKPISSIAVSGYSYHFTEIMFEEHPKLKNRQSTGHQYDLKSNVFDKLPEVFKTKMPRDEKNYARILGRENNERCYKYIDRRYINDVENFDAYKIFLPKASGIGEFGEALTNPILSEPGCGSTETFFSIGKFSLEEEAEALRKYLSTKFARALLSILKKTQMLTPGSFDYVPLQDFTATSDIDWSKSIQDIDLQLYRKYNLSDEEANFLESHVKEMA